MSKIAVSILGIDCPGVVYLVSGTLSALRCNIEEISQTILKGQFAAIFIAEKPDALTEDKVHSELVKAIDARDMTCPSSCVRWMKRPSIMVNPANRS